MRPKLLAWTIVAVATWVPAHADWLVYIGGGLAETRGTWEVRGRQALFHSPNGTLLSVRAEDVDLPASAFLSWQVGNRRQVPGRPPAAGGAAESPTPAASVSCVPGRLLRIVAAETLVIELDGREETVHLACLDAPETRHKFPELAWYGTAAARAIESVAPIGAALCVGEESPGAKDRQGHRLVYLTLADGGDLGNALIAGGFGLTRGRGCSHSDLYRDSEDVARQEQRGLWGEAGSGASIAVMAKAMSFSRVPPAPGAGRT